jgi:methionyl-tRNA formyltransferase
MESGMRIIFLGTSELGIPSLEALIRETDHEVRVFTKPDQTGGRGRKRLASPIKRRAQALGLNCAQPEDMNAPDVLEAVRDFDADVLVTASYWAKLSEPLLAIPRFGGVNIHPSLLPRFRGAAPIQHALLHGDSVTGVTIFRMSRKMDGGAILGQVSIPVAPDDTYLTLHDKLAREAAPLLLEVLKRLNEGKAAPVPQDESKVVPAPKLSKRDGLIPWDHSAKEIHQRVRAVTPWPGAYTFYALPSVQRRILIIETRVAEEESAFAAGAPGCIVSEAPRIVVACGKGYLEILRLKREGKKEMSAEAFLRGMPLVKGQAFQSHSSTEEKA